MNDNIKTMLDDLWQKNCNANFIKTDPIQIPHLYHTPQDIEIMGFIASMMAFGSRKVFIPKLYQIVDIVGDSPSEFLLGNFDKSLFDSFGYRHFSNANLLDYLNYIKFLYQNYGGFGNVVKGEFEKHGDYFFAIKKLRDIFIQSNPADKSSYNFFGNIEKNSACKKLNMFFRWMIRKDDVDFGIWDLPKSKLYIPLDVHVLNNAFALQIVDKKTVGFSVAVKITQVLQTFDPDDPIKYDFALFGMSANE